MVGLTIQKISYRFAQILVFKLILEVKMRTKISHYIDQWLQ